MGSFRKKPKLVILGAPYGVPSPFAALISHAGLHTLSQVFCSGSQQTLGGNFTWTLEWGFGRLVSSEETPTLPKVARQIKIILVGT